MLDIFAYEMRWPTWTYRDRGEDLLSTPIRERLKKGQSLSLDDYRNRLDMRQVLRAGYNLPLLADRGLPMGIQLLGHPHQDYALALRGKWFSEAFPGG